MIHSVGANLVRKMRVPLARWIPLGLACMLLEISTRASRQMVLSNYVAFKTGDSAYRPIAVANSKLRTTGKVPFTGTVATRHTGVDIYENVCLATVETGKTHRNGEMIRRHALFSYTPEGLDIGTPALPWAEWADWVTKTQGETLDAWEKDSKELLIEEETLLMLDLFDNPAHCLTDQVFSVAVDILSRGLQRAGKDNTFYPKFFRAQWTDLPNECPKKNWCCQFMNMLGIISTNPVPPPPNLSPVCFRRLIVPHHAAYRFPHEDPFLLEAVEKVQRMALDATHLQVDPWKRKEVAKMAPILLYDRRGTGRRIFQNSRRIKQLLETKYHANVVLVGKEWNNLTDQHNVTSQAIVYNSFPYIIAPHGAHLTNLLFSRKGTRVMELMCWIPGAPKPRGELFLNLTRKEEANDEHDWYGEPSPFDDTRWFYSFSRKLAVEHFVYSEYDGCMEDGKLSAWNIPAKITVDETRFVSFVASRFKLRPRNG